MCCASVASALVVSPLGQVRVWSNVGRLQRLAMRLKPAEAHGEVVANRPDVSMLAGDGHAAAATSPLVVGQDDYIIAPRVDGPHGLKRRRCA